MYFVVLTSTKIHSGCQTALSVRQGVQASYVEMKVLMLAGLTDIFMEPSKTELRSYLQKECGIDVEQLLNGLLRYLELPENQIDEIDILEYKFLDTMLRTEPVENFIELLKDDDSRTATRTASNQNPNDGKTPSSWSGFGRKNAERKGGVEVIRISLPNPEHGE